MKECVRNTGTTKMKNPHAQALGKLGGKKKSKKKSLTSKENGKKGGRPKDSTLGEITK